MNRRLQIVAVVATLALGACAQQPPRAPISGHLLGTDAPRPAAPEAPIPAPVNQAFDLPPPKPAPKLDTYSVVVSEVPVEDLLFALARDARLNVDVHPGLEGTVTLNAIDQTLPQILKRIARQVDMRFELDGESLVVMPDSPFLRTYQVDYVLMSRETAGTVSVATQIATAGSGSIGNEGDGGSTRTGNSSATRIENRASNRFWETLVQNVKDILRETDKLIPADEQAAPPSPALVATPAGAGGESGDTPQVSVALSLTAPERESRPRTLFREAASVIAHPESGVMVVRATSRQHERVQEFLDAVIRSARRQVLIEATIAEVQLSRNFRQGIDWSKLDLAGTGIRIVQNASGVLRAPDSSLFEITYSGSSFSGSIKLLETFGNVRVLSSPKLSVLNNQTAVLKVVDNIVYFTIESDINQNQTTSITTFTTTVNSVPIGFVMNVTPQISEADTVLLNLRPSLSRVIGQADDPNPALRDRGIVNSFPVIRTREIESVIRVENGNIAVMGGLMEDARDDRDDTVPVLSRIPLLGNLFMNRDDTTTKTELVIFLRPTVIREASLDGDYREFREHLPGDDFFSRPMGPQHPNLSGASPLAAPAASP
ncbi:MAG: secretin N-terminal domain-containing protein [Rhodocyclaceae bacterium]|nr:secretin N-terminal domain-containing protein [Rhodocyclaceae bacterium]